MNSHWFQIQLHSTFIKPIFYRKNYNRDVLTDHITTYIRCAGPQYTYFTQGKYRYFLKVWVNFIDYSTKIFSLVHRGISYFIFVSIAYAWCWTYTEEICRTTLKTRPTEPGPERSGNDALSLNCPQLYITCWALTATRTRLGFCSERLTRQQIFWRMLSSSALRRTCLIT
jgi:hypothetical protein